MSGEPVEQAWDESWVDDETGREDGGEFSGEFGRSPGRMLLSEGSDGLVDQGPFQLRGEPLRRTRVDRVVDDPFGVEAEGVDLLVPLPVEGAAVDPVGLGGPGVDDGFSFEPPAFAWRRVTFEGVDKSVELLVESAGDVAGAGGELLEDNFVQALELGDPVRNGVPADAEAADEFSAQGGVVDGREGALIQFECAGVEGEPPSVGGADAVGEDDVGVQVWVECS